MLRTPRRAPLFVVLTLATAICACGSPSSNDAKTASGNDGGKGIEAGLGVDASTGDDASKGDAGTGATGTIAIAPTAVTLDLVQGQASPTQAFTVTFHAQGGDQDVTAQSTFALADPTLGAMNLNVFAAGPVHGGATQLVATFMPPSGAAQTATATIGVHVRGAFQAADCGGGCGAFPPDSAPLCAQATIAPQIAYPPDGVLLPPNMESVAVQWTPFPGGPPALPIQQFEIDFENASTDVRVVTKCATELQDTAMTPTGCEYALDPTVWDFIAKSNRGGDPVKVTVRATSDGMCATPSTSSVNVAFGEQDLNGGIFYWKSSITAGGVGGGIWAKAFGSTLPEEQITGVVGSNLSNATCFGCHAVSRDGKRMTVSFDDADSDDEYGDIVHTLMDLSTKSSIDGMTTYGQFEPGFQAIAPNGSVYVATDGVGVAPTNIFYMFNAMTGAASTPATATIGPAMVGSNPARPTMPDWSPDGKSILYVEPEHVASWDQNMRNDDSHVFGGSIVTAPFNPANNAFGVPTALVTSAGENNYYPGFSPDGAFVVFDRVTEQTVTNPISGRADCTGTGQQVLCPNDSFSNPKARVWLTSTQAGGAPVDAEKANGSPASAPVDVSNSWPRWSPFVQTYKGDRLLWVTFSSTRDYGLRVRNHKAGMFQCYPADSPQQAGAAHSQAFDASCQQPQIWMAAINLSHLEAGGADPSFVAFWLPFQDDGTHNHTAQWTQGLIDLPQTTGACIPSGNDCTAAPNGCCAGGICTSSGLCGPP